MRALSIETLARKVGIVRNWTTAPPRHACLEGIDFITFGHIGCESDRHLTVGQGLLSKTVPGALWSVIASFTLFLLLKNSLDRALSMVAEHLHDMRFQSPGKGIRHELLHMVFHHSFRLISSRDDLDRG